MVEERTFEVEEYTIGSREKTERIIFTDKKQLLDAKQAFNDGRDILVKVKDENGQGLIITVPQTMISNRLYKGEIVLAARDKGDAE